MTENSKYSNGMELARAYYDKYGKEMIHSKFSAYEDKIAVGLVGEGSDCFGYDDALSTDHDFGPDFCMWLSDETYAEIGEELQKEYEKLPIEFGGYKRVTTAMGQGRRGVLRISDFYKKYIGTDCYEEIDFSKVEDYALAVCTNGEVFRDDEGIFSSTREKLKTGYPEHIRLLKIAQDVAGFSQCGQYNYLRMLKREDKLTAGIMLSDFLKHAMKLYHHILNVYPPHDKWLFESVKNLPDSEDVVFLLSQISEKSMCTKNAEELQGIIESLAEYFAMKMYEWNDISDVDSYLDHHIGELLYKADISKLSDEELVNEIAIIEFKAFDKVKNEGGRASCQNDWPTFSVMRKSQYLTWNREMLIQYMYDFTRELKKGHNLITEKYGRMMESTAPDKYEEIKNHFPVLSEQKKAVIEQIVGLQMQMVESVAKEHPKVIMNARSLHTYEDNFVNTSYETYLRGEISTYSDKMLQLYGKYVVEAVKSQKNIAYMTMENTAKLYGYKDIVEFEKHS